MRSHDDKNQKKIEELAQSMLNNHLMVATVTTELQEFKRREEKCQQKVNKKYSSWPFWNTACSKP